MLCISGKIITKKNAHDFLCQVKALGVELYRD
jgi:hypothetical protein